MILAGCTGHRPVDVAGLIDTPKAYTSAPEESPQIAQGAPWWESFEDPDLDHLMTRAFTGNLDLQVAWARVRQARAGGRITRAAEKGSIDLSASQARRQLFLGGAPFAIDSSSVSLPMRFETDLFGKLDAATRAANLDAVASGLDLETLALSLSAELAQAYVGLREQMLRRRILVEQRSANENLLESLKARYTLGQSSSLDYYQQEQLTKGTRAQVELVGTELARLQNRLAVLVGAQPGHVVLPEVEDLPDLPALPGLGVPSDLLTRRPDLRAVEARLRAADQRLYQALADRLPSVVLTGSVGYQAGSPGRLFRNVLRSLSGEFLLPLLDGGRRRATTAQRRAQVDEWVASFRQAYLRALEEVETALGQETAQRRYLAELEGQEQTASQAFDLATARYQEGVEDFIRVLSALQSLQQVQVQLVSARAQLLRYRIQLCRALGGDWTTRLPVPGGAALPKEDA
jgi:NodT family efflux transporter outer membrane factor (OMF) lipoprotein